MIPATLWERMLSLFVDVENVFEDKRDWSEGISAIKEESPDLAAVKALRPDGDKHADQPISQNIEHSSGNLFPASLQHSR